MDYLNNKEKKKQYDKKWRLNNKELSKSIQKTMELK
jgi:hypothetical protein